MCIRDSRCNELEINRYKNRISEPLLDRIDLYVQMSDENEDKSDISSDMMFDEVLSAFKFQKMRGQKELNSKLSESDLQKIANLDDEAKEILSQATSRYALSHR